MRFRATAPGTYRASAGRAASPLVRIGVVPRVSVTHTATTVAVATVPARVGARVALQTYDRDHFTWRTVAHTRLDAALAGTARDPGRDGRSGSGSSFAARQAGPTPLHR